MHVYVTRNSDIHMGVRMRCNYKGGGGFNKPPYTDAYLRQKELTYASSKQNEVKWGITQNICAHVCTLQKELNIWI
jgi:hypothetical protein